MKYVKISAKVDRRIKVLMQSGKTGKVIAEKVVNTIENIKSGTVLDYRISSGSFTKYGERRIKNCRKFDFACGYRLVTFQKDSTIHISFLGTHDECQRWLDNNSSLNESSPGKGTLFSISDEETASESRSEDHPEKYYYDEILMNLSEQDLRNVFCGIVESAKKRRA
jgi:hypothetical protein